MTETDSLRTNEIEMVSGNGDGGVAKESPPNRNALQILCRLRPGSAEERQFIQGSLSQMDDKVISIRKADSLIEQQFVFDHIFGENSSQEEVFHHVACPLLESLIQGGSDALVFAYGVSSSGKSYTINGIPESPGLIPLSLAYLFSALGPERINPRYQIFPDSQNGYLFNKNQKEYEEDDSFDFENLLSPSPRNRKKFRQSVQVWSEKNKIAFDEKVFRLAQNIADKSFTVFLSFVEIYNNYIFDLLEFHIPGKVKEERTPRPLVHDAKSMTYVQGAREIEVTDLDQAFKVFLYGLLNRRTGSTQINETSSRSHSVFTIKLVSYQQQHDPNDLMVKQFSVVDLAGIERANRTQNTKLKLAEASNINNSLMALRACFEAIRKKGRQEQRLVIPYRQSKLTLLLKRFFEFQTQIRMIICIKPDVEDHEENIQVLSFGQKAQQILIQRNQDWANNQHQHQQQPQSQEDILELQLQRFNPERVKNVDHITVIQEVAKFIRTHQTNWNEAFVKIETIVKNSQANMKRHVAWSSSSARLERRSTFRFTATRRARFVEPCKKLLPMIHSQRMMFGSRDSQRLSILLPVEIIGAGEGGGGGGYSSSPSDQSAAANDTLQNGLSAVNDRFRQELKLWNQENVDWETKLIALSVHCDRFLARSRQVVGSGPSCSRSTSRSGGQPSLQNLDVFNRLYLQSPARYKMNASQNRAMIRSKKNLPHKTGNNRPNKTLALLATDRRRVKSLCRKFENQTIDSAWGGGARKLFPIQQQPDSKQGAGDNRRAKQQMTPNDINSYDILQQRKVRRDLFLKSKPPFFSPSS